MCKVKIDGRLMRHGFFLFIPAWIILCAASGVILHIYMEGDQINWFLVQPNRTDVNDTEHHGLRIYNFDESPFGEAVGQIKSTILEQFAITNGHALWLRNPCKYDLVNTYAHFPLIWIARVTYFYHCIICNSYVIKLHLEADKILDKYNVRTGKR